MNAFTIHVDVPDSRSGNPSTGSGQRRRVAGLLDDNETVVIATMIAGAGEATEELSFTIKEAVALAEQAFAGDERALTTPGLARKLCALSAILFRVCHAAGALTKHEGFDDGSGGHSIDRLEAAADEVASD